MIVVRNWVTCAFLGLFLLIPDVRGATDPYKSKRAHYGVLYDVKVYNPDTKSYFELKERAGGFPFQVANAFAKSQIFRGVRGRLAVIDSMKTQNFINRVIRPPAKKWGETWIGLRLTCRPRKLVWVTGKVINKEKEFTNWGRRWHYRKSYLPCQSRAATGGDRYNHIFAGIALHAHQGVMRWWAIAPGHYVRRALIEYPTGKP